MSVPRLFVVMITTGMILGPATAVSAQGSVEQTGAVIRQIVSDIKRDVKEFRNDNSKLASEIADIKQQRETIQRAYERETDPDRKLQRETDLLAKLAEEHVRHWTWVTALRGIVSRMATRFRDLSGALESQRQALGRQPDLPRLRKDLTEWIGNLADNLDYWEKIAPPELQVDVKEAKSTLMASVPAIKASLGSLDVSAEHLAAVIRQLDTSLHRIVARERRLHNQRDRLLAAIGGVTVDLGIKEARGFADGLPGLSGGGDSVLNEHEQVLGGIERRRRGGSLAPTLNGPTDGSPWSDIKARRIF